MMRVRPGLAVALSLALLGSLSCRPRQNASLGGLESDAEATFLEAPLRYCRDGGRDPVDVSAQLLIDASGSMVGFKPVVPELVRWVQHGMSMVQESVVVTRRGRIALFSEGYSDQPEPGLGMVQELNRPLAAFVPSGNTNLHAAIRSATGYDITLIVTDGVAAIGAGGAGDCAGGVDAACVARSLRDVITQADADTAAQSWGVWLFPIVAEYNGRFFSEARIAPEEFSSEIAHGNVVEQFGGSPVVGAGERLAADGTLVFNYQGPRAMMLLVIARRADLGRAVVGALWNRSEHVGVSRLKDISTFSDGIGLLGPMELYPGFVEHIDWQRLEASPDVSPVGTIDAVLDTTSPARSRLRVDCPAAGSGQSYYRLDGEVPRMTEVAGCVDILLLPALSFQLKTRSLGESVPESASFIRGFRRMGDGDDYRSLELHIACGPQTTHTCADATVISEWRADMDYGKVADCLADPACAAAVPGLIRRLSTLQPNLYPHRIYGLAETLEEFFRATAADRRSQLVGEFEICRGID